MRIRTITTVMATTLLTTLFALFLRQQLALNSTERIRLQRKVAFKHLAVQLCNVSLGTAWIDLDGGGLCSWRFKLWASSASIPSETYPNWADAWNSPANARFTSLTPLGFARADATALALGVSGRDTALDLAFRSDEGFPRNLILVMETADRQTHWMEPNEFRLSELEAGTGRTPGSDFGDGFFVLFADGGVWCLRNDTPLTVLCRFLTVKQSLEATREELVPYSIMKAD